ncbi:hypothetical protein UlMin_041902 [Ulmus minor]
MATNPSVADRLNDRRGLGDPNQGQGDLHNGGNLNPVNHQIHELQRDPADHLENYRSWMELNSATNAFKCRAFVITLTGVARRWFRTLRPGTLSSFRQLSESFISQFAVHKIHRKPARHLYTITQRENETTESYLTRFVKEDMNVQDRSNDAASGALMAGLRNSTVLKYLVSVGKPDTVSYPELITEIRRHIDAEKASNLDASKLSQDILLGGGKRKMDSQVSRQDDGNNGKKNKTADRMAVTTITEADHRQLKYHDSASIPHSQRQSQLSSIRQNIDNHDLEVRTIMGGTATGETNRARKNYARQSRTDPLPHQVNLTGHKEKIPRLSDDPIIFTEGEARGLWHPHTDAIVVTLRIAGRKLFRILVDNGSYADILFKSTFNIMNLVGVKIEPTSSSLSGFTGDSISSEGILNLPVGLGSSPCQHIQAVDFVLVDCPSPYNAIIGRPTLNKIRAVTSTYHLLVKFPTEDLIIFLREHHDVLAWSHEDMPGIDPSVIVHRLNIDPNFKPVKQKRRTFNAERYMAINTEVDKLLKAEFIEEANYPDWIANVVLVKKANGNWRVCVDFTDLNPLARRTASLCPELIS